MELTISPKPKYEVAKLRLETAILSGEYKPGDQIPSERDLALLYNISYMTVRRAILELVSDNILERRAQKGTFVNAYYQKEINKTLTKTVLNLIVSSYEAGLQREFLSIGVRLANKKGWFPNVVRLSEGQQEPAVIALRRGYSLVMLDDISPNSSLGIALRKASNKVVIVGQVMSSWGITSVHYNVRHAVELAVNHLRDAGHRDIGFVVQYPADLNNQMKVAVWEDMMADTLSPQEIGERLLQVNTKRYQSPTEDTVNAIVSFFGEHPRRVSAFLCSGEELALGILAGCRICGLEVPTAISLINIGDSSALTRYSNPAVTCVDGNLEIQLTQAINILQSDASGGSEELLRHIIEPRLIEQSSVSPVSLRQIKFSKPIAS